MMVRIRHIDTEGMTHLNRSMTKHVQIFEFHLWKVEKLIYKF